MSMTSPTDRPLISFVLIAYNQDRFIAEAVQGAFSQTYSPLEIILSDDCSPDRTFEIMQEMAATYRGPHTLILNRNEHNLGLIGHINRLMEMVTGELIVIAAGDDVSLQNRVERIVQEYLASGRRAYSIFSNAIWIDEHSQRMNLLRKKPVLREGLSLENYASRTEPGIINGCTHAWRRDDFDLFGPLPEDVGAEDTTIPFRSALLGEIAYIHEPLVLYRRHINRVQNQKRRFNFRAYRQARIQQKSSHLAMYRSRLRDIECLGRGLAGGKDMEHIKQITIERMEELRKARISYFRLWYHFLKTITYWQYQDLWRFLRTNRDSKAPAKPS